MVRKGTARWLALSSAALLGAAAALPQAALADKPAPHYNRIVITDKGFDKPLYRIGDAGGTGDADKPAITVVNEGTRVHGVKTLPGTLDEGVMVASFTDAMGTVTACYASLDCGNSQVFDSGGIPPGGSVVFGFDPPALPTDYVFTSPTDCLFGNSTPGFDCAPSRVHVSDSEQGLAPLSHSIKGSWVFPVGDPMCRTDVAPVTPTIGPPFCYGKFGVPGRVAGSSKHPVGHSYTIHITDFGYDPADVYVEVPATVTWVNDGQRVHTVHGGGGKNQGANDFQVFDSPGIGPGESYSYTFTTYSADDPAAPSTSFSSTVDLDLLPVNLGSTKINSPDNARPHCSTKHKMSCGTPLMTGKVDLVDPNAMDWYHGPGSSTPQIQDESTSPVS